MTVIVTTLTICLLQRANAQSYSSAVYSSSGGATWLGKSYPYSLNVYPYGGNDMGGGGPTDYVCAGAIKATFSKTGGASLSPAQTHVIVEEQAYASWLGKLNVSCSDGIGDAEVDTSSNGPPFPLTQSVSTGTHYVSEQPDSSGNIVVSCTPAAAVVNSPASQAEVAFSARIIPVTISLSGTTLVNSSPEILPGQMCAATLNVPAGFKCTSCTWTIGGTYYASWTPGQPPTPVDNTLLAWPNATYPATGSPVTPEWYWDDTTANTPEKVSCIATFAAPDGSSVTASAATSVEEEVPMWSSKPLIGTSDWVYSQPVPGSSGFWVGLYPLVGPLNQGYELDYSVNLPQGFNTAGDCGIAQLAESKQTIPPNNPTVASGLDDQFPYPLLNAGGSTGSQLMLIDFPAFSVTGVTSETNDDTFQDYLMFRPSGLGSQWVPLNITQWKFDATANEPSGGWKTGPWGLTGGGTAQAPIPTNSYPLWTGTIQQSQTK